MNKPAALAAWTVLAFAGWPPASQSQSSQDSVRLRILAYNIRHGEGMDRAVDLTRAAAVINALRPDIVTLQEVDVQTRRTGGVDQARTLGTSTGMAAVFGDFMPYQGGLYGMAVLSRHPIVESTNHRLPPGEEPRSALAARIRVDGRELVVASIHLYRTAEERYAQAQRLIEVFREEPAPVILAGDFNSTPESQVMRSLGALWTVADKGSDRLTFSSTEPRREIDFILYKPDHRFRVIESRVIDEPLASDHRPVMLELELLGDAPES